MGSRGRYPWWDGPRLGGSSWWLLLWPHSWPCLPELFRGPQASRRGPTARGSRGHRGWSHGQAVDSGWPSGAWRRDRLGAWGQGRRRRRRLLLVHLLEVLLPGPHLRVLQLLHVEGLSVGQQLLPLVLQLPDDGELSAGGRKPQAHTLPPLCLLKSPASHSGDPHTKPQPCTWLPLFSPPLPSPDPPTRSSGCLHGFSLWWTSGLNLMVALVHFQLQSFESVITFIWKPTPPPTKFL